jgi:hypothetical protein
MEMPSLCIPRVINTTTENQVKTIVNKLNLGTIERIDIVSKKANNGTTTFKSVYIHFKTWFPSTNTILMKERFHQNKDIKIIYDDPWFWKVSPYKNRK